MTGLTAANIAINLSSIKEINNILKENKHISNNSVLVNKYDFKSSGDSGILINLEDLFKMIDTKFLGIIEYNDKDEIVNKLTSLTPHTDLHLSINRISKRIIKGKYLNKISNISYRNTFSMEILYNNFNIIEKKSF